MKQTKFKTEDKLLLKEYILEIQGDFTISMLLKNIDMERRSLTRFIYTLIDEEYVQKVSGWKYTVVVSDSSWKLN